MKSLPPGCHDSNFLPLYSLLPMRMQSWGMKSSSLPSTMLQSCCSSEMQTTLLHPSSYNPEVKSRTIDNESIFDKRILVVVNRILFRFGFGRKFRPKHVSVSAFRLSPLSVIRPKQVFWPKEAVSAEITVSAKFILSSSFPHVLFVLKLSQSACQLSRIRQHVSVDKFS